MLYTYILNGREYCTPSENYALNRTQADYIFRITFEEGKHRSKTKLKIVQEEELQEDSISA